jgi:hypothetical protein
MHTEPIDYRRLEIEDDPVYFRTMQFDLHMF